VPDDDAVAEHIRLGDWLRAQRLRRGFSYAEIENTTRINRLYLEALEDEHFDAIPAPVYVRGFLRSYAKALGLDPEHAIALLPDNLPRPPGLEPSFAMRSPYRDAPAISMPSLRLPRLPTIGIAAGSFGRDTMRWLAAIVGAVTLVLAAIYVPPLLRDDSTRSPGDDASALSTPGGSLPADARAMPNLIGEQQANAQRLLQELGVTWVTIEIASPSAPAGQVVGHSPSAGAAVRSGDNVTLTVSRGAPQ
jgi:hypothetical protein